MIFYKDPVMQLTAFVLIGVIISMIAFNDNTKSPLETTDQPQHLLLTMKNQ